MAIRRDWKIERSTKRCSACKMGFAVGQKYFSAIYPLAGSGLLRRDFCLSCWPRFRDGDVPPLDMPVDGEEPIVFTGGYLSYWKTSVPEPREKQKRIGFDPHVAFAVFQQAIPGDASAEKERLRFILALSLVRHKVLKLKNIERSGCESFMILADRSRKAYEVRDPGISEEEILGLMESVGELLEMSLGGDTEASALVKDGAEEAAAETEPGVPSREGPADETVKDDSSAGPGTPGSVPAGEEKH